MALVNEYFMNTLNKILYIYFNFPIETCYNTSRLVQLCIAVLKRKGEPSLVAAQVLLDSVSLSVVTGVFGVLSTL